MNWTIIAVNTIIRSFQNLNFDFIVIGLLFYVSNNNNSNGKEKT